MLSYIDVSVEGLEKIKEGIVLDIQIIKDRWYQPHMFITENELEGYLIITNWNG